MSRGYTLGVSVPTHCDVRWNRWAFCRVPPVAGCPLRGREAAGCSAITPVIVLNDESATIRFA